MSETDRTSDHHSDMAASAALEGGQPPNGFLTDTDREEAAEPMLPAAVAPAHTIKIKVDGTASDNNSITDRGGGGGGGKKAAAAATVTIAPASARLQTPVTGDTSAKNYKVICRLVLAIILALIAILCSVFIKPELYFPQYGEYVHIFIFFFLANDQCM